MSERFTVKKDAECVTDNEKGIAYLTYTNRDALLLCELLNELHEENMELKCKSKMIYERDAYKKLYEDLREENKQLKQYKKAVWDCDSSKIIRVNKNTGEVDLLDKELKE